MWIGKKKYRDMIERIEELEAAVLLWQLQKKAEEQTPTEEKPKEERKPLGVIKSEWMLFEDERKGVKA
jgi:hypothetical protein